MLLVPKLPFKSASAHIAPFLSRFFSGSFTTFLSLTLETWLREGQDYQLNIPGAGGVEPVLRENITAVH